jgi:hypothetical protein
MQKAPLLFWNDESVNRIESLCSDQKFKRKISILILHRVIPYENDENPWRPLHRFDRHTACSIRIDKNKNFLEGF